MPENGHVVRVAAESGDVLVHPPERHRLVEQAVAGCRLEVFAAGYRRKVHEAVHVQAVVDVHQDDVALRLNEVGSVVAKLRTRTDGISSAVNPDHHRLLLGLVVGVKPDVQVEAVLGGLLLYGIRIAFCAESTLSVVLRLKDPVARVHVLRCLEAALSHWRLRVGDAQPRRNPVLLSSDEGAVHTFHGMGLVVVSCDFAVQVLIRLINNQILEFPFRTLRISRFHAGMICPRRFFGFVLLAGCVSMGR